MNEQLQIRAGQFVRAQGVKDFYYVTSIEIDRDESTLDIWYKKTDNVNYVIELDDPEDFLTFLVTGGK